MLNIFSKLLDINQREIDRLKKIVDEVNGFSQKFEKLKDKDFVNETEEFKKSIRKSESSLP